MERSIHFITRQIDQLSVFGEWLASQVAQLKSSPESAAAMLCQESMLNLTALLTTLHATRQAFLKLDGNELLRRGSHLCEHCDD